MPSTKRQVKRKQEDTQDSGDGVLHYAKIPKTKRRTRSSCQLVEKSSSLEDNSLTNCDSDTQPPSLNSHFPKEDTNSDRDGHLSNDGNPNNGDAPNRTVTKEATDENAVLMPIENRKAGQQTEAACLFKPLDVFTSDNCSFHDDNDSSKNVSGVFESNEGNSFPAPTSTINEILKSCEQVDEEEQDITSLNLLEAPPFDADAVSFCLKKLKGGLDLKEITLVTEETMKRHVRDKLSKLEIDRIQHNEENKILNMNEADQSLLITGSPSPSAVTKEIASTVNMGKTETGNHCHLQFDISDTTHYVSSAMSNYKMISSQSVPIAFQPPSNFKRNCEIREKPNNKKNRDGYEMSETQCQEFPPCINVSDVTFDISIGRDEKLSSLQTNSRDLVSDVVKAQPANNSLTDSEIPLKYSIGLESINQRFSMSKIGGIVKNKEIDLHSPTSQVTITEVSVVPSTSTSIVVNNTKGVEKTIASPSGCNLSLSNPKDCANNERHSPILHMTNEEAMSVISCTQGFCPSSQHITSDQTNVPKQNPQAMIKTLLLSQESTCYDSHAQPEEKVSLTCCTQQFDTISCDAATDAAEANHDHEHSPKSNSESFPSPVDAQCDGIITKSDHFRTYTSKALVSIRACSSTEHFDSDFKPNISEGGKTADGLKYNYNVSLIGSDHYSSNIEQNYLRPFDTNRHNFSNFLEDKGLYKNMGMAPVYSTSSQGESCKIIADNIFKDNSLTKSKLSKRGNGLVKENRDVDKLFGQTTTDSDSNIISPNISWNFNEVKGKNICAALDVEDISKDKKVKAMLRKLDTPSDGENDGLKNDKTDGISHTICSNSGSINKTDTDTDTHQGRFQPPRDDEESMCVNNGDTVMGNVFQGHGKTDGTETDYNKSPNMTSMVDISANLTPPATSPRNDNSSQSHNLPLDKMVESDGNVSEKNCGDLLFDSLGTSHGLSNVPNTIMTAGSQELSKHLPSCAVSTSKELFPGHSDDGMDSLMMMMTDSQLCQGNIDTKKNDLSEMGDKECEVKMNASKRHVYDRKEEGKQLAKLVLNDLTVVNCQLLRLKRDMDATKRKWMSYAVAAASNTYSNTASSTATTGNVPLKVKAKFCKKEQ